MKKGPGIVPEPLFLGPVIQYRKMTGDYNFDPEGF